MNKLETAEAILVMQAWIDGAEIELSVTKDSWHPISDPDWGWEDAQYRIKPSPHEGYVRLVDLHNETGLCLDECIKVREVL